MASVLPERQSVNGRAALDQMFEEAYRSIEQVLAQRLMLWWEAALTTLLGREPHERRVHVRQGFNKMASVPSAIRAKAGVSAEMAADLIRFHRPPARIIQP